MKKRTLDRLVEELRQSHTETKSWEKTSITCRVLTMDGRADPALAFRIAMQDYDPARLETRRRLRLPPVCVVCGRKVRRERHVPNWVEEAVGELRRLEEKANGAPEGIRVYGRGGRRLR